MCFKICKKKHVVILFTAETSCSSHMGTFVTKHNFFTDPYIIFVLEWYQRLLQPFAKKNVIKFFLYVHHLMFKSRDQKKPFKNEKMGLFKGQ